MWRSIVPVDVRWQILLVVRSIPDARYVAIHYSQNTLRRLSRKIWSTRKSDDRPRTSVWIWNIPKTSGHQEHPHYSVLSPSKWMVVRLHRSLKASSRAELTSTKWLEHLPLILLGPRTTMKKELNCSAAEALYGTTLRLHAQYFLDPPPASQKVMYMASFVDRLSSKNVWDGLFPSKKEQKRYTSPADLLEIRLGRTHCKPRIVDFTRLLQRTRNIILSWLNIYPKQFQSIDWNQQF